MAWRGITVSKAVRRRQCLGRWVRTSTLAVNAKTTAPLGGLNTRESWTGGSFSMRVMSMKSSIRQIRIFSYDRNMIYFGLDMTL